MFRYISLVVGENRTKDALQVVQTAVSVAPDNQQFRDLLENLKRSRRQACLDI